MRKKTIAFIGLMIALGLFFEYIAGSNWHFITSKTLIIYQQSDAPLEKSLIAARIPKGELLVVNKCFFDKDDAYMVVKAKDGISGYAFETKQVYTNDWEFSPLISSYNSFISNLTCWRLIDQFGLK